MEPDDDAEKESEVDREIRERRNELLKQNRERAKGLHLGLFKTF